LLKNIFFKDSLRFKNDRKGHCNALESTKKTFSTPSTQKIFKALKLNLKKQKIFPLTY
jgi:hypothetical protein